MGPGPLSDVRLVLLRKWGPNELASDLVSVGHTCEVDPLCLLEPSGVDVSIWVS